MKILKRGSATEPGVIRKLIVGGCILGVLLIAGCGTAANEVAGFARPERQAPAALSQTVIPSASVITVVDNLTGNDFLTGAAGAVEGGATVRIYDCFPGGTVLRTGTAAADGSFSIAIGEDDPNFYVMYITVQASGKTESEYISLAH